MPDYLQKARALRAKAASPVVTAAESQILLNKARELESKYGNVNSPSANDTTVTGRDGIPLFGTTAWSVWTEAAYAKRMRDAQKIAEDLLANQWKWNDEYYDQDGNPKPQRSTEEDIVEDMYQYDHDYDYDYDYDYEEYGDNN